MKKIYSNYDIYVIVIIIIFFTGCSVESNRRTLSFFFDGVDEAINSKKATTLTDSASKNINNSLTSVAKKNTPEVFFHKPFLEKKCEQCHTEDKRLLKSPPELCYLCHKDFKQNYKYVHGPVANGICSYCHSPHSSNYAKLLNRGGQQTCTNCHSATLVFKRKIHKDIEDADCTLCHNPHGGNSKYMIKDNIAKKFKGLDELGERHVWGVIYNKEPGDINAGNIEIVILDNDGEIVSSSVTDVNGSFQVKNLHPDQNYIFRFKSPVPDAKIYIVNNKNEVLYVVKKNKDNKFLFDKSAYRTAHFALARSNQGVNQ